MWKENFIIILNSNKSWWSLISGGWKTRRSSNKIFHWRSFSPLRCLYACLLYTLILYLNIWIPYTDDSKQFQWREDGIVDLPVTQAFLVREWLWWSYYAFPLLSRLLLLRLVKWTFFNILVSWAPIENPLAFVLSSELPHWTTITWSSLKVSDPTDSNLTSKLRTVRLLQTCPMRMSSMQEL